MKWLAAIGGSLMVLGAMSNTLVMRANGGAMPVAASLAGVVIQGNGPYVEMTAGTQYRLLGDIIRIGPRDFYSVGDFALWAGAVVVIVSIFYYGWQLAKWATAWRLEHE